jgi:Lrp/AsnC family leucine-responsive transcriptional regulator
MKPLDAIDIAILEALQKDGRMALSALAREVGLSGTACTERVRGLEADGIITGYAATIDGPSVGLGLLAFIEVSLERVSREAFAQFRAAVERIPEIEECHMVAGGFDYLLKVRVADMAAYRAFLGEALAEVPGIRQTHSYPVMEAIKQGRAIGLSHLSHARALSEAV